MEEATASPASTSLPTSLPRRPRRNYPRSRLGCLTCRTRKKKCCETRPCCTGCARNKLDCVWPAKTNDNPGRTSAAGQDTPTSTPTSCTSDSTTSPGSVREQAIWRDPAGMFASASDPFVSGEDNLVPWSSSMGSFASPARTTLVASNSRMLLRHYLASTSGVLPSFRPVSADNPFLTVVLPLAHADDLVMHGVLTLSGAHWCYQQREQMARDVSITTMHHYSCVLRSLQAALDGLVPTDTSKVLRILLVLALVAEFESMTTRCVGGTIFPHLRASRQLILWLSKPENRPATEEDQLVYGFILELYSFLVLKNSFLPYGLIESRTIPYDPIARSVGSLACYPTFGVRFFGLHGLFELIAPVSELAARRLEDKMPGASSAELEATYDMLQAKITGWCHPAEISPDSLESKVLYALGETYRYALLVFLETAMAGSVVRDPGTRAKIQRLLDVLASHLLEYDREHSMYDANLGWPIMVGGSCLENPVLRRLLLSRIRGSKQDSWVPGLTSKLLELLWEDEDERAFGPYGIHFMKKHGMNYGFS